MYLPRSLTLTATDELKTWPEEHKQTYIHTYKQTYKKADISKGEDIGFQSEELVTGEKDIDQ